MAHIWRGQGILHLKPIMPLLAKNAEPGLPDGWIKRRFRGQLCKHLFRTPSPRLFAESFQQDRQVSQPRVLREDELQLRGIQLRGLANLS